MKTVISADVTKGLGQDFRLKVSVNSQVVAQTLGIH